MSFALRHRTQHMHLKSFVCTQLAIRVVFENEQKWVSLCTFDSRAYKACKEEQVLWFVSNSACKGVNKKG